MRFNTRFAPTCNPGTPGRAGRGLEVDKALFFPPSSTRGIFPRLVLSWAGERSRTGSSCPSNRETQQETPLRWAVLPCSGGARAQEEREGRIKEGHESRVRAVPGRYSRAEAVQGQIKHTKERNHFVKRVQKKYVVYKYSYSNPWASRWNWKIYLIFAIFFAVYI